MIEKRTTPSAPCVADGVVLIFGQAFFKKLARVWGAEPHVHGISFLQSFFLCAYGLKEKSVERVAQHPRLPPEEALQRAGIRLLRSR